MKPYPATIQCNICKQNLPKERFYWRKTGYILNRFCKSCFPKRETYKACNRLGPYTYKKCRICKFEKMCKEFPTNNNIYIGWEHICIECKSKGYYKGSKLNEDQLIKCNQCNEKKLQTEFPKSEKTWNGFYGYCHKCRYWHIQKPYRMNKTNKVEPIPEKTPLKVIPKKEEDEFYIPPDRELENYVIYDDD